MASGPLRSDQARLDPRALLGHVDLQGPWQIRDLGRLVITSFIGLLLIAGGAVQARNTDDIQDQLAWLCLAVIGLAVCGARCALWILQGRLAVGAARSALLPDVVRHATVASASVEFGGFVTGPSMSRYHRPSCLLVRGKDVAPVHDTDDLVACEVCEP